MTLKLAIHKSILLFIFCLINEGMATGQNKNVTVINFEKGKYNLDLYNMARIDSFLELKNLYRIKGINIAGFANAAEQTENNINLAENRIQTVYKYILTKTKSHKKIKFNFINKGASTQINQLVEGK